MATRSRTRTTALLIPLLVALVAVLVLARAPHVLGRLGAEARHNNSYSDLGRTMAAADSLDIDNEFVATALVDVPPGATFAVVPPAQPTATVGALTIEAVHGYFRYLLLPRREVDPAVADYVLCYGCDPSALPGRWTWIWTSADNLRIGKRAA